MPPSLRSPRMDQERTRMVGEFYSVFMHYWSGDRNGIWSAEKKSAKFIPKDSLLKEVEGKNEVEPTILGSSNL